MMVQIEPWVVNLIVTYAVLSVGGLIRLATQNALLLKRVGDLEHRDEMREAGIKRLAESMQRLEGRAIRIETILDRSHREPLTGVTE